MTQVILSASVKDYLPKSMWDVFKGVFRFNWGSLKSKPGLPMCEAITSWVKDKKIGKGVVNIVITDFVDEYDFIPIVIAINHK